MKYLIILLLPFLALAQFSSNRTVLVDELKGNTTDKIIVKDEIELEKEAIFKHITTPTNPASGFTKMYIKADEILYVLDSAGNENPVGVSTLQGSYDNSTNGEITVSSENGAVKIQDNATSIEAPLFQVLGNAATSFKKYFEVGLNYIQNVINTTAERPIVASAGMQAFNSDEECLEVYNGTEWTCVGTGGGGSSGINFVVDGSFEKGEYNPTANASPTVTYGVYAASDELYNEFNEQYWQGVWTIPFATNFYIRDSIARTGLENEQGFFGIWIANNASDDTKLTLCLRIDDASFAGDCNEALTIADLKNDGEFHYYEIPFVFGASSVQYEIAHPAITQDITVKLDDVYLGTAPKNLTSKISDIGNPIIVSPITIDAVTTAPTKGTTSVDRIIYTKEGANIHARYEFQQSTSGTNGSGDYLFRLPDGLKFNTDNVSFYTGTVGNEKGVIGHGVYSYGTSGGIPVSVIPYDETSVRLLYKFESQASIYVGSTAASIGGSPRTLSFNLKAPIAGWQSHTTAISQNIELTAKTANELSAITEMSGTPNTVSSNYTWIDSYTDNGTGRITINFDSLGLVNEMSCVVEGDSSTGNDPVSCERDTTFISDNTQYSFACKQGTVYIDRTARIKCSKQGSDVKKKLPLVGTFKGINSTDLCKVEASGSNGSAPAGGSAFYFTETSDNCGNFSSNTTYISSKATWLDFSGRVSFTVNKNGTVQLYKNGVLFKSGTAQSDSTTTAYPFKFTVQSAVGDTFYITFNGSATLSTGASDHYLSVTELPDHESIIANMGEDFATTCETRKLLANTSATGVKSDLDYTLEIGEKYSVKFRHSASWTSTTAAVSQVILEYGDGTDISFSTIGGQHNNANNKAHIGISLDCFEPSQTDIQFNLANSTATQLIGGSDYRQTYAEVCKLPKSTICKQGN